MSLSLLLANCSHSVREVDCPQPPPVLLQRERSLEEINPLKMPLSEKRALEAWAHDIAAYEGLRERHSDLQNWLHIWCLSGKK
jgi:hypothetical protein